MLNERKKHILRAIVDDYISTAEPIGSKTIAKKYDLGVSPATIRNEMADLEAQGYITNLHASSGRIPSAKGYRFYVDDLLTLGNMPEEEIAFINNGYKDAISSMEDVFKQTARIISQLTKNVSIILAPKSIITEFTYIRFIPLSENKIILVIMTDGGVAENKVIDIPQGLKAEAFDAIGEMINIFLSKFSYNHEKIKEFAKMNDVIDEKALELVLGIMDDILMKIQERELYLGGTRQLMDQPEFNNIDRVKSILGMLEEEKLLYNLLKDQRSNELKVIIGQENKFLPVADCSIISATFQIHHKPMATVAVLGPTRMDYGKIISLLNFMHNKLDTMVDKMQP